MLEMFPEMCWGSFSSLSFCQALIENFIRYAYIAHSLIILLTPVATEMQFGCSKLLICGDQSHCSAEKDPVIQLLTYTYYYTIHQ